ncbi:MAG: hypothetical protein K9N46_09085 [Candidatus Marinimicrobia bacterium]|nr:hypothetical protein [Candidatus Neomarinimicrobiota bacterium]MCF7829393.1 hypothetical protein [Candidatus Neomarinimicrobiota bacterium]MCF7880879.1 hypothetical protein [Candidatus Neomarinimicrobiota bacterium]
MSEEQSSNQSAAASATITGPIWLIGWLFTIGYAQLTFVQGIWAVVLWPFYLGITLSG